MGTEAELLRVVDRLYAATVDRALWRGALREVAGLFRGRMANLEVHDTERRQLVFFDSIGGEPGAADAYERHYVHVCPRVQHLFDTEVGDVHYDYSWFSERELARSEFYEDFLTEQDLRYYIGATLVRDGRRHGLIAIQRSREVGHVDRDEIDTMRALVPHLTRALEITTRLGALNAHCRGLREALSRLTVAVALVDARGKVVYANDAARDALRIGFPLGLRNGRVSTPRRNDQRRLSACVQAAILGKPGPASVVVGEGSDAISVSVCRLPSLETLTGPFAEQACDDWLAMLVFEPISLARSALGSLRDLGLAPAEARLAVALADGISLAGYAANNGISINTARTHLARIRGKLACATQADVVRRVLQLVPRARQGEPPGDST